MCGTDIGGAPAPELDGDGIRRVIRWRHANLVGGHVEVNEYFGGLAKQCIGRLVEEHQIVVDPDRSWLARSTGCAS